MEAAGRGQGKLPAVDDVLSVRRRARSPASPVFESLLIRLLAPAIRRFAPPWAALGLPCAVLVLPCAAVALLGFGAAVARGADYVPGAVLVGYETDASAREVADIASKTGVRSIDSPAQRAEIVRVARGVTVAQAIAKLRRRPGVRYAVPNYVAHEAGSWIPDDPGLEHRAQGWQATQWNFLAASGVNAPEAWANLFAVHRGGGRGVVVAVLDTGVAFRNWKRFRKAPDLNRTRFVDPCDLVAGKLVRGRCTNRYPLDRNGHGTFIAGEIAESTNNGRGLTGLAYGVSIMPVRILDGSGDGDAATISRGIRYAVNNGAKVVNLSLEFDIGVRGADIPDIIGAISYAEHRGVVVVGAAGNEGADELAYPAADTNVISVGATTSDRCLADYSNYSSALDLVAPGGGDDSAATSNPVCRANATRNLPSIFQQTLTNAPFSWTKFGYPGGMFGTSMAAAEVSAAAALEIASGVVGPRPSPAQILRRLEQTAVPLGVAQPDPDYGYGLLDAGAATAPSGRATAPTGASRAAAPR